MSRRRNATASLFRHLRRRSPKHAPLASGNSLIKIAKRQGQSQSQPRRSGRAQLPPDPPPSLCLFCPSCTRATDYFLRAKGPHLGAYCATCRSWLTWIKKQHQPEAFRGATPGPTKPYGEKTAGPPEARPGLGLIPSAGAESVNARP